MEIDLEKVPPAVIEAFARATANVVWNRVVDAGESLWNRAKSNPGLFAELLRKAADVLEREQWKETSS